jgi:hypothetical protein
VTERGTNRFRAAWALGRARSALLRHVHVDLDRDPASSVVVAGSARSGTTWLGDLLARALRARVVFEPLNHERVPELRSFGAFPYRRPDDDDRALESACRRMLSGRLSGAWVDRELHRLVSRRRVVKLVRGNLLLAWLAERFPETPMLLLVRHPCAVVASRLALGWDPGPDLEAILAQERLLRDHLEPYREPLAAARTPEERTALVWCLHHLVPLRQRRPDSFTVVHYEHLAARDEAELARLWAAVGGDHPRPADASWRRPSRTSRLASAAVTGEDALSGWRRQLRPDQIEAVLAVVRAFGLDAWYGEDTMPRSRTTPIS